MVLGYLNSSLLIIWILFVSKCVSYQCLIFENVKCEQFQVFFSISRSLKEFTISLTLSVPQATPRAASHSSWLGGCRGQSLLPGCDERTNAFFWTLKWKLRFLAIKWDQNQFVRVNGWKVTAMQSCKYSLLQLLGYFYRPLALKRLRNDSFWLFKNFDALNVRWLFEFHI